MDNVGQIHSIKRPIFFASHLRGLRRNFVFIFFTRQRELGEIVHQVLDQQMNRQHWQERDKRAGHQYREDVTEI